MKRIPVLPTSAAPALTAIVVARDDEERIGHALRHLTAHLATLDLAAELLVVDERSGDNTVAVLSLLRREIPGLEVLVGVSPGQGYVEACRVARGRTLLLVDARTEPSYSALGFALRHLDEERDAWVASDQFLLLHRVRCLDLLPRLRHRRNPAELERRFRQRAGRLGLRIEASPAPRPSVLSRLRHALLSPAH